MENEIDLDLNSIISIKSTNKSMKSDKSYKSDKSRKSDKSDKSKKSDKSHKQIEESVNLSVSQLEFMANKKKMAKKQTEESIKSIKSIKKTYKKRHVSSEEDNTEDYIKYNSRKISKENQNEQIRIEKSDLLYKFHILNENQKLSSLTLNMNNSLSEIKNEYTRIYNVIESGKSLKWWKDIFIIGIKGSETLNKMYDPFGCAEEYEGFGESLEFSFASDEYDDVMRRLYEKYSTGRKMEPELEFILMIVKAAVMFTATKKLSKLDPDSILKMMSSFVPPQNTLQKKSPKTTFKPQQGNYQGNTGYHVNYQGNTGYQEPESSEEPPSKIKLSNDLDIINALKQMNENKKEKEIIDNIDIDISEYQDLKNIPMQKKKKIGRPKKINLNN